MRDLVEFVYRRGDLISAGISTDRLLEGSEIHRAYQQQMQYPKEIYLSHKHEQEDVILTITGRIDCLIQSETPVVEEIKSCLVIPSEPRFLHAAQAKLYAYLYGQKNEGVFTQAVMVYISVADGTIEKYPLQYTQQQLQTFYEETVSYYIHFLKHAAHFQLLRNDSVAQLGFPFENYRPSQRELAAQVYTALRQKQTLYISSPTGTGKTVAVLYPAIKALVQEGLEKLFFLTARGTNAAQAQDCLARMYANGLRLHSITLTAKEEICPMEHYDCNPEVCPYANGYLDRINTALYEALPTLAWDKNAILAYCTEKQLCPFEFSLDLSLYCDVIICDCNYAFHPAVKLMRYFGQRGKYALLVDEAHNLVERARDMFSATLSKENVMQLRRVLPKGDKSVLSRALEKLNKHFITLAKEPETFLQLDAPDETFIADAYAVYNVLENTDFSQSGGLFTPMQELFLTLMAFLRVYELYGDGFVTYYTRQAGGTVKMYCIDTAPNLQKTLSRVHSAVFFSGTLQPMEYYRRMLSGERDDPYIILPSPFAPENFCVAVEDSIATTYRERAFTFEQVAQAILYAIDAKPGNYMAFFPSYAYLQAVLQCLLLMRPALHYAQQSPGMAKEDRQAFLQRFIPGEAVLGLAVMGGIFGESIDLEADKLIGAIVVGVGLPQVSPERELIRQYFNDLYEDGFAYAYRYPGINRVLQAAGRVIRTPEDKGTLLLIDKRFTQREYLALLPDSYHPIVAVNAAQIAKRFVGFWQQTLQ